MKFACASVQVRYSRNHDFLRTIGFLAVVMAVPWIRSIYRTDRASCYMLMHLSMA